MRCEKRYVEAAVDVGALTAYPPTALFSTCPSFCCSFSRLSSATLELQTESVADLMSSFRDGPEPSASASALRPLHNPTTVRVNVSARATASASEGLLPPAVLKSTATA